MEGTRGKPTASFPLWPWRARHASPIWAGMGTELRVAAESDTLGGLQWLSLGTRGWLSPLALGHSRGSGSQTGAWGQPELLCHAGTGSS